MSKLSLFERAKHRVLLTNPEWSDEEREEKQMMRRLDIFFCSWASLSAVVKYLDQTNINNAYVSGLKEDLNLYGNELNLFTTYFNIGYLICIPLSTYVMNSRLRPSIWMPATELTWGVLTGCLAAVRNVETIYAIRFLIGFAEGTAWPGTMVLILSWYKPTELGKRLAIYQCATSLGGIMSGALQAALYTNLNGALGLAGWRWLFVVNSVITVVVASWGFVACPDYPNRPNPWAKWWMREKDAAISLRRMNSIKRKLPQGFSWKVIKSVVSRPQNWALWFAYEFNGQGNTGNGYFNLWLRSLRDGGALRYTVQQVNTIPIASSCIQIASLGIFLTWSDRVQIRYPFILALLINGIIWSGILANGQVSDGVKMTSYLLINFGAANTNLFVAWLGELCRHSAEERAIIISAFVTSFYAIAAGLPLIIWPASKAPEWPIGFRYASSSYAAAFVSVIILIFLERRQNRIDARAEDQEKSLAVTSSSQGEEDGTRTPASPKDGEADERASEKDKETPGLEASLQDQPPLPVVSEKRV